MLFEHCFYVTKSICALISLHEVTREIVAALTDPFADAFVRKNVGPVYDVVATFEKFDAAAILFREILCKK